MAYNNDFINTDLGREITILANNSHQHRNIENLKKLFSLIDLTSLNTEDNKLNISAMSEKVNSFKTAFPDMPDVAAICVYPQQIDTVKATVKPGIEIAAVGACFPSSQTFLETKIHECKAIVEHGADEIDIVISVGKFLEGNQTDVFDEIKAIKEAIGDIHLKVILETGALDTPQNIWDASILAMEAGADFIKTSTGKQSPAATPEAVYVMCKAISEFHKATGKKVGIKPAGGIATPEDAIAYLAIVSEVLGEEWLNNKLFRIGASRLANNLLTEIHGEEIVHF